MSTPDAEQQYEDQNALAIIARNVINDLIPLFVHGWNRTHYRDLLVHLQTQVDDELQRLAEDQSCQQQSKPASPNC